MLDGWTRFDVAVARWRLGELMAERLPSAAEDALAAGCDVPSLALLAAMDGAGWSEVEPVLERVLAERGRRLPSHEAAVKDVADDILRRIVSGEDAPDVGATRLRHLSMKCLDAPAWKDLGAFHHFSLDWEVAEDSVEAGRRGAALDDLRVDILNEARTVLARGDVRAE